MQIIKHPQFILAVETKYLTETLKCQQGFNDLSWGAFMAGLDQHVVLKQRTALENDKAYMQLLPYVVITSRTEPDMVFAYQRTDGVGENRLAGNYSIGGGGHIDLSDVAIDPKRPDVIDLETTIYQACRRELVEEFCIDYAPRQDGSVIKGVWMPGQDQLKFQGLITDFRRDVESVHVALVFHYQLESFKRYNVSCREDELLTVGPRSLMRADAHNAQIVSDSWPKMEPWSKILIERGLYEKHHRAIHPGLMSQNLGITLSDDARPLLTVRGRVSRVKTEMTEPFLLHTPIEGLSMAEHIPSTTAHQLTGKLQNMQMRSVMHLNNGPFHLQPSLPMAADKVQNPLTVGHIRVGDASEQDEVFDLKLTLSASPKLQE